MSQRERILEAAARCFARWGVEKTTLEDIAKDANLSRPNIYNSFANKDDLIRQAVLREATAIVDYFIKTLPLEGQASEIVVRRFVSGIVKIRSSQPAGHLMAYEAVNHRGSQYPGDPELLDVHKRFWVPLFDYARSTGELIDHLDDDEIMHWLLSIQLLLLEHQELYPTELDVERLLRQLIIPAIMKASHDL